MRSTDSRGYGAIGYSPTSSCPGATTWDFTKYGWTSRRTAELTLNVDHDPSAAGFVPRHQGYRDTGTPRFLRLAIDDGLAALAGGRSITLDGAYTHNDDSMGRGPVNEDASVVTATMRSGYDETWGHDVSATIRNRLATFPA